MANVSRHYINKIARVVPGVCEYTSSSTRTHLIGLYVFIFILLWLNACDLDDFTTAFFVDANAPFKMCHCLPNCGKTSQKGYFSITILMIRLLFLSVDVNTCPPCCNPVILFFLFHFETFEYEYGMERRRFFVLDFASSGREVSEKANAFSHLTRVVMHKCAGDRKIFPALVGHP